MTNFIRKDVNKTTVKVILEPKVMEVASRAIYDGVFLTSSDVNEKHLTSIGFTEENLTKYLQSLVTIRVGLVTQQIRGVRRSHAKNYYVPAGIAQMLVAIGEVEIGSYTIQPEELSDIALANIDWEFVQEFSDTLLRMKKLLSSVKNILVAERSGDASVMALIVSQVDTRDAVLSAHANADEKALHPVKQAFALLAGIKLAQDHLEILYPNEVVVDDYRSALEEAFSNKVNL